MDGASSEAASIRFSITVGALCFTLLWLVFILGCFVWFAALTYANLGSDRNDHVLAVAPVLALGALTTGAALYAAGRLASDNHAPALPAVLTCGALILLTAYPTIWLCAILAQQMLPDTFGLLESR